MKWTVREKVSSTSYLKMLAQKLLGIRHTEQQLPLLVFSARSENFVIMKQSDFIDWFGDDSASPIDVVKLYDLYENFVAE